MKALSSKKKGSGLADVRFRKSKCAYRIRFYDFAPDPLKTVLSALKHARNKLKTKYDSVALEHICKSYLSTIDDLDADVSPIAASESVFTSQH